MRPTRDFLPINKDDFQDNALISGSRRRNPETLGKILNAFGVKQRRERYRVHVC